MDRKARTGAIGEQMVMLDLAKKGYEVAAVNGSHSSFDVFLATANQAFRVQVKATQKQNGRGYYHFLTAGNKHRDYDLIAFVAVDSGLISYMPGYNAANCRNRFADPQDSKVRVYEKLGTHSIEDACKAFNERLK